MMVLIPAETGLPGYRMYPGAGRRVSMAAGAGRMAPPDAGAWRRVPLAAGCRSLEKSADDYR